MQWQKSKGYIYNTTDLGTIKSVTVNSSAGTFTTYYGTSSNPSSGTTVGGGYFNVKVGSATGKTSSVVVTFEKSESPTATLTGISVTGTAADLWTGDDFTHEGITVTATYDDGNTANVTNSCKYSGCDMSTAGSQTVTVSYGEKPETASYTVNVKTIGNTKETAYTASKAIELIDAGKGLKTPVYVKGKVSEIVTAFSSQYGNITFNVSEDGTTEGAQFQFFRNVKGANNEKYTSEDECPAVGDEVICCGLLYKYGSTYELNDGNYLVEKIVSTDPSSELTLSQTTGEVNVDKTLDISGYVSTADGYTGTVTYAVTTGAEYASVSEAGVITGLAVGKATVKVTAPAIVDSFSESSAEFTVTVVENRTATTVTFGAEVDDQTFNVNLGEKFVGKTATVDPAEAGTVTYSSDNKEVASVDENTGAITIGSKEGTATITASFAATDNYQASSAKYYITVTDPNVPVFKKVASNDDIIDGEQYLIICEGKNKAMSSYNSSKYYNVVDVTITDNSYEGKVNAEGLPYTVTVHKSATDGYYTLETAEGYVKSTTSDNTSIFNSEMTSEEDVFLWKLDVTDSNSPIYSKYVPARFISYNSNNPRIALYKSTTASAERALVSLYKKVGSKPAEPAYGELTFKAQDSDGMYYATFSSNKDVVFTN
ncbi:MAG: Ig-like domain-containing protein, partial [Prevotella sp.]|nr:Ig-like domain-containing protein [Prevotella sp.]